MTPYRKTTSLRSFSAAHLTLTGCIVLMNPGCAWHLEVPPKGEALPSTVTREASPSITTAASLSQLRFKALLLDGNGNLILESGEQIRVRVDVVNTGPTPIQNALASLTGTPSVIEQFLARTLTIPPLQPGETKSLEFAATLPSSHQPQHAEIRVSITEAGGAAARPQVLVFIIQPAGAGAGGVDQIPTRNPDFQQPHTYLVSIGVGAYRDPKLTPRRYAAMDAETVANYFHSLNGLPPSNVRLLQNSNALHADIDKVLFDWLPLHMAENAVVIVYFSGQALVTPTGDVLLAPYDGNPAATAHLYPLRNIESALARLKAKQALFFFDGMVSRLRGDAKGKTASPRWELGSGNVVGLIGGQDFTKGVEDDQHRHGLFTYYLLKGLRGDADTNRDAAVTFGEIAGYLRQKVAWAAKSQFNEEQRPQILPTLKPGDSVASLVLSKLASMTASETP